MEAANRVRLHGGLGHNQQYARPLIVVVTKYDAWRELLPWDLENHDVLRIIRRPEGPIAALDVDRLRSVSASLRRLLQQLSPELVNAAEGFCSDVTYIPTSALGQAPQLDAASGGLGVQSGQVQPLWADIPILHALHRCTPALVRAALRTPAGSAGGKVSKSRTVSPRTGE